MIGFPVDKLLDEQACYDFLVGHLHPGGMKCPDGHPLPPGAAPHDRSRAPILDYRCKQCGRVFNLFTDTLWQKTRYRCSQIIQIVRGFAQGVPTFHLARELDLDRGTLLKRRHELQALLEEARPKEPLADAVTEADEMYQNAGEKRYAASRPPGSSPSTGQQGPRARNLG